MAQGIPTVTETWPYGILRAGMFTEEFGKIVRSIWDHYWVPRRNGFVRYPTSVMECYIDELGTKGDFGNVILTSE